jgi:DNA-directed RNA polymerase specialized sigma24 family protein
MSGAQQLRLASLHDVELATLAATGDRRAFGELVRRHGSGVRGLLRRMGAPGAEADDVAQDAFLAAFEGIAEYRGEGAFAGWVKRIAARQYLRRLQREKRLAALAIEAEAVKSHVKRGLEKLRTRLAPADGASLEGSRANG